MRCEVGDWAEKLFAWRVKWKGRDDCVLLDYI